MSLSPPQKSFLRSQAHHLRPVVMLGQRGLTDSVLAELGNAMDAHELIKVRIGGDDRESRVATIDEIIRETGADLVQRIGHIAVFFRRNEKKPRIALPA